MYTKIFGVTFIALTGLGLWFGLTIGNVLMGAIALGWAICWLANV